MKSRNEKRMRPSSDAQKSKLEESRRCKHDRNNGERKQNKPEKGKSEERSCCPRAQSKDRNDGKVKGSKLSRRSSPN